MTLWAVIHSLGADSSHTLTCLHAWQQDNQQCIKELHMLASHGIATRT